MIDPAPMGRSIGQIDATRRRRNYREKMLFKAESQFEWDPSQLVLGTSFNVVYVVDLCV